MFVLMLNDMRAANVETMLPVARAETAEELDSFLEQELANPYVDGQWSKVFKKDGPLEWYNPPFAEECIVDVGTKEDWMQGAALQYDEQVMSVPPITEL